MLTDDPPCSRHRAVRRLMTACIFAANAALAARISATRPVASCHVSLAVLVPACPSTMSVCVSGTDVGMPLCERVDDSSCVACPLLHAFVLGDLVSRRGAVLTRTGMSPRSSSRGSTPRGGADGPPLVAPPASLPLPVSQDVFVDDEACVDSFSPNPSTMLVRRSRTSGPHRERLSSVWGRAVRATDVPRRNQAHTDKCS